MSEYTDAIIRIKVPSWQIGQQVRVFFPDSMVAHAVCEEEDELVREVAELREEKKLYYDKAFNSVDKTKLSDHLKNRLIQTAMNNMETIMPYSKVCEDIVDNRIDIWIDEVK